MTGRTDHGDQDVARTVPVTALAVGLVVLLATTWLVPTGGPEQAVHDFAGARTGLGLFDGPWQSTEPLAEWTAVAGVAIYIAAAIAVLLAAHARPRIPMMAACVGLAATVVVLSGKPGPVESVEWDYAWQSPPYLACALWLVLIIVTGTRSADARSAR